MKELQGRISGMAIPKFVIDLPGGGGKIPVLPPEFLVEINEEEVVLRNYEDKVYHYPQPDCYGVSCD